MKPLSISCAVLLASIGFLEGQESKEKPVPVEQLDTNGVVGRLGLRLGQVFQMEGEIVSGDETGAKADQGILLLKITSVAGKSQDRQLLFPFSPPAGARIGVGTKLKFQGYETGGFTGLPKNPPPESPSVAGPAFHFESRIVILSR